jgi:hypothetical protein
MSTNAGAGVGGSTGGGGDASTGGGSASTGGSVASTGGAYGASTAGSTGGGGSTVTSTGGSTAAFSWGDGWRERLAGGDEKTLQRLGRFTDPDQIWKAYRELENRMHTGQLKPVLAKDAKPEEVAQWRKDMGIPEKPEGYTAPEGLVIGDDQKDAITAFQATAHALNYTPQQYQDTLKWWYEAQDAQAEKQAENDAAVARATQDALRGEWQGHEYRANMNAVHSLLDKAPTVALEDGSKVPLKDLILGARLPNGIPIGSSPEALKWLAQVAREIDPAATVVPGVGANQPQAIADEINNLKVLMANKQSEYWKGPKAETHQARYRELIDAQAKLKARGAG